MKVITFNEKYQTENVLVFPRKIIFEVLKTRDMISLPIYLVNGKLNYKSGQFIGAIAIDKEEIRKIYKLERVSAKLNKQLIDRLKVGIKKYEKVLVNKMDGIQMEIL